MNQRQYMGVKLQKRFGLHPFHKMCHTCPLDDCKPSNKQCPQHQVLGYEPKGDISWHNMTLAMIDAGMRDQLGDIPVALGIEEAEHE